MTRRTLTLFACMVAVLAAACSNSNQASIPAPVSVEKSTAIAAGDAVCTGVVGDWQRLVAEFDKANPQPTPEQLKGFLVDTLIPRIETGVGAFHRIGQPTKDKTQWNDIVLQMDTDLHYYRAMIDGAPTQLLTTVPFEREAARLQAYGFKECGKAAV